MVAGRNGWLAFLDSRTGRMTTPRSPHHTPIGTARTGRDGTPLVTADDAGVTAVWDVPSRAMLGLVRGLPRPSAGHLGDAWVSPDGRTGATLRSSRITLFDVAHRIAVRQLPPAAARPALLAVLRRRLERRRATASRSSADARMARPPRSSWWTPLRVA